MFTELMALCVLINKSSSHDVFCNFSGHVDLLDIRVYIDGWTEQKDISYKVELHEGDDVVPTLEYLTSLLNGET